MVERGTIENIHRVKKLKLVQTRGRHERGVKTSLFIRLCRPTSAVRPPTRKKLPLTLPLSDLRRPTWHDLAAIVDEGLWVQSYKDFYTLPGANPIKIFTL